jgi:hypothetical protein
MYPAGVPAVVPVIYKDDPSDKLKALKAEFSKDA